jgi:hypothetical protein
MLKAATMQRELNAGHQGSMLKIEAGRPRRYGWITKHNLVDLASRAGLGLKTNETRRVYLERFTEQVEWASRYPTDKHPPALNERMEYESATDMVASNDHVGFCDLFDAAHKEYEIAKR